MLRTFLSYLVLILVPVVSLAIAVVPYVWVKRKYGHTKSSSVIASDREGAWPASTQRGERSHSDATNEIASRTRNDKIGLVAVPLHYLWGAFVIGLVGNVVWWWITGDLINSEKFSIYIYGTNDDGILFGFFLYSVFLVITPFIFYKLRHGQFTAKAIVYNIIISLITAGLVLGVWIVLALIAYRGLFYQLN